MNLKGKKIAIMATDFFEESELVQPMRELQSNGAAVEIIAPHAGKIQGMDRADKAASIEVDKTLDEAKPLDYDAIVLPGGTINADKLRVMPKAKEFVKAIYQAGKPTAVICHAPWVLVSAGLARGKKMTSYPTLQDDIKKAGGNWVDEEVAIDKNLITSRNPDDLPAFNSALISALVTA